MSRIERVENRIRQIEQRIENGPNVNSAAFNKLMSGHMEPKANKNATFGSQDAALNKLTNMGHFNLSSIQGRTPHAAKSGNTSASVVPLAQSNNVSCGQTSVAMSLNALTGKNTLTDMDIDTHYGFRLLDALKNESREVGYDWRDAGNIDANSWSLIDQKVNNEGLPVIVALNGPEFSPSGRGHIVTIVKTEGDTVTYADPADGQMKTTTKQNMTNAPDHPDGNFIFVADNIAPAQRFNGEPYAMNQTPMGPSGSL